LSFIFSATSFLHVLSNDDLQIQVFWDVMLLGELLPMCWGVGYCRIACSDNHSITHITTIFNMVLVIQSGVGSIPAQLLRLAVSVTGFSPVVLTAGGKQGCCDVKRTSVSGKWWCTAGYVADCEVERCLVGSRWWCAAGCAADCEVKRRLVSHGVCSELCGQTASTWSTL
jgi:hypothetical protein